MNLSKDSKPLVSIVVLTYNQAKTIPKTLDHILAQKTDFPFEIIIGEDASPSDKTRKICEAYQAKYPSIIRLMPKVPNKGVVKNYHDCLKVSRGNYIAVCAGDDWWHNPCKLALQISFLEEYEDYGVVHSDCDLFYAKTGEVIRASLKKRPPEGEVYNDLLKKNFIFAPTAIYKQSLLKYIDFDKYDEIGMQMEDYPMWLEISRHTKIHYLNKSTVTYSVLLNSLSHNQSLSKQLLFEEQSFAVKKYFIEKYPDECNNKKLLYDSQQKTLYMTCLGFKEYKKSFDYVDKLGVSVFMKIILKTRIGAFICSFILNCSLYKRIKGY